MEKRLRSSLQTSPESFLAAAATLPLKPSKPTLKALVHSIPFSSPLSTSLPLALHSTISTSLDSFKHNTNNDNPKTPASPPAKRPRRFLRKNTGSEDPSGGIAKGQCQNLELRRLSVCAHIVMLCGTHPNRVFEHEGLVGSARELHDNLVLFEEDAELLSEVSGLCEEWWKGGFVGRELISQFLPFLVSRSLTLKKKVDIRRVYVMREAFGLFDFEDESIEDLKLLIMRCVISPLYLKAEDGRRFIAFTMGLSVELLKEALAMIRSQIPFGKKSVLEAYGEIVFRGWKGLDRDDLKREMEDGFLQGLVEGAILAGSTAFAASVRRVIGGFINQRTNDGVEKLLFRIAEPVIFRSLQVANSNVRHNALHLLLDMFPLEDPDATKEAKDTLLDKQFFLLERLLSDECPEVRVMAVEGCCRVLHLFWEIIPSSTITKLLTKIFDDMSLDASNEVRLSTVNGVIYLLGNPQSHEVLKVLLPRLGHMILDSVLSIHLAVSDLLLLIGDIRGFQFNKVVALDALLTTLTNDQPLVAQKITRLLLPSYFPSKVSPAEACNRFITLIKRSPAAGARFCEFAESEGASKKALIELVVMLINMALAPHNLASDQLEGLLTAVGHLCDNLASEASCKDALKKLVSCQKLKGLFDVANGVNARSSLFNIASALSSTGVAGLLEECVELVSNCGDLLGNGERQAAVRSAHKMILSSGWFDAMFETITRLLQIAAMGCHRNFGVEVPEKIFVSGKRKKSMLSPKLRSGRGSSVFEDEYQIAVGIGWQIRDLLKVEASRKAIFDSENLQLVCFALTALSEVSITHCMCCDFMDSSLVTSYTTLALQIALQNIDYDSNSRSRRKSVGPSANKSAVERDFWAKPGSLSLECKVCSNKTADLRLETIRDSPMDESTDIDNQGSLFTYGKRISNMVKVLTAVLKFIVEASDAGFISEHHQRCLRFTSSYFRDVMTCLRQCFHEELMFKEAGLREIFVCLKSSFSYGAKLITLILIGVREASPAPTEIHDLASDLLDLVAATESYCGSRYAIQFLMWLSSGYPT
ncbi:Condensin-2 complex subunit G2-like protein [Drosera capensis]